MNSPDPARPVSVKQEEPEDQPDFNILHMVVCKEEDSPEQEQNPSLLQEEPESPHIKEEQEELLLRPGESDGSTLTLPATKEEEDDDEDTLSYCSGIEVELESDSEVTEDSDEWEETSGETPDRSMESSLQVKMSSPEAVSPELPAAGRGKRPRQLPQHFHDVDLDQCVESRLQVKMHSPESARAIHMKQEEPEDHPHFNILHMVVCQEELPTEQERSPSLLQEEPEPPHIKEEPEELLLPDGPMLTLQAVRSEVDVQDIYSHCCELCKGVIAQSSQTQVFSCSECSYALTSQVFLYKHIKRRHLDLYCQMLRDGQITSAACKQVTTSEYATKRAARGSSQKGPRLIKTLICKHCNKNFTPPGNLTRRKIQGTRSYYCIQCNKTFYKLSSLNNHKRSHTLEKNFQCTICNKSYKNWACLKSHHLLHIGESQRPYHCKQCYESFFRLSSLNTHERIHTLEQNLTIVKSIT